MTKAGQHQRRWCLLLLWCVRALLSLGTGNPYDGFMIRDGAEWVVQQLFGVPAWTPVTLKSPTAWSIGPLTGTKTTPALEETLIEDAAQRLQSVLTQHGTVSWTSSAATRKRLNLGRGPAVLSAGVLYGWPWVIFAGRPHWLQATIASRLTPRMLHLVPSLCFMQPLLALFEYTLWSCLVHHEGGAQLWWLYLGTVWSWPCAVMLLRPSPEAMEALAVLALLMWICFLQIVSAGSPALSDAYQANELRLRSVTIAFVLVAGCVRPASALYTLPLLMLWGAPQRTCDPSEARAGVTSHYRQMVALVGACLLLHGIAVLVDAGQHQSAFRTAVAVLAFQVQSWFEEASLDLLSGKRSWLRRFHYRYRVDFLWTTMPWLLGPHLLDLVGMACCRVFGKKSHQTGRYRVTRRNLVLERIPSSVRTFGNMADSTKARDCWEAWLLVASMSLGCYSLLLEREWASLLPASVALTMMSLYQGHCWGSKSFQMARRMLFFGFHVLMITSMSFFREAGLAQVPLYLHQQRLYPHHLVYAYTDMPPRALLTGSLRSTQVHHLRSPTPAYLQHYVETDEAFHFSVAVPSILNSSRLPELPPGCATLVVAPSRAQVATKWSQLQLCRRLFPHWSAHLDWRLQSSETLIGWARSLFTLDLYCWCPDGSRSLPMCCAECTQN